jgi:exosortase A
MDGDRIAVDFERVTRGRDSALAFVIVDRRAAAWRVAIVALAVGIGAILVLCRQPALGAVRVWIESATFNHGFLIVPISLYMIWERRDRWQYLAPRPAWAALTMIPAIGLVYVVGAIASVLELQQFATVAFVQVLLLVVLGWRLGAALAFPLLYLFFMVPSGEWLVPRLQDFTATFVVHGLQWSGVPVYSDGVLISIPEAEFRIAEACAGIRFLIASIAFGCLFADLVYASPWRKALFIALSSAVPIFANGMRALTIVMIAHWSDARYAVGVDHVIYGWLFFTVVTILLMGVGWTFRDRGPRAARRRPTSAAAAPVGEILLAGVAAALLASLAPVYARWLDAVPPTAALEQLRVPAPPPGWQLDPGAVDGWRPLFIGADREIAATYRSGPRRVRLVVAFYVHQRQDAKAVSSLNRIADDQLWERVSTEPMPAQIDGQPRTVPASRLVSGGAHLLAWQWYWIGGRVTASPFGAKLLQLETTLLEGRRSAAAIAIAAPYDDDPAEAAASLTAFTAARPDITSMLRGAAAIDGR